MSQCSTRAVEQNSTPPPSLFPSKQRRRFKIQQRWSECDALWEVVESHHRDPYTVIINTAQRQHYHCYLDISCQLQ